jgi:hypothetical protein
MNNTEEKSTQKLCPILGSHGKHLVTRIKGIETGALAQTGYDILSCQGDNCELWHSDKRRCSIYLIAFNINWAWQQIESVKEVLERIEVQMGVTEKENHGNS